MPNSDCECRCTIKTTTPPTVSEAVAEYNLPDYLPDIARLMRTSVRFTQSGQYINGTTLEYDGRLDYSIIYATSDGRIKSTSFSSEAHGKIDGVNADGDCEIVPDISVQSLTCRLQNPRRLSARTRLSATADVICDGELCPDVGKTDAATADRMQKKCETAEYVCDVRVADDSVPVSEDIELDASMPRIGEIIFVELTPFLYETRYSSGKIGYKGDIVAQILYSAQTETPDEVQKYYALTRKIPIYGEVDAALPSENGFSYGCARINSFEYRSQVDSFGENSIIEIDLSYTATLHAMSNEKVCVISDMFSVDFESVNEFETVNLASVTRAGSFNFSSDATVPADDGAFPIVVTAYGDADITGVEKVGSRLVLTGQSNVSVITTDGQGSYMPRTYTVPIRAETEAGKTADSFAYVGCASVLDVTVRYDGDGVRINEEIGVSYGVANIYGVRYVCRCNVRRDAPTQAVPSADMILDYSPAGTKMWHVAKKYSVSPDDIAAANGVTSDTTDGRVLMIPHEKKPKISLN
ncbi:MAG: DUF3794 domain-containing protein [Clostridia bacterium]|nr:DUF3794 domain-containing protein [Clostridia bacterium]